MYLALIIVLVLIFIIFWQRQKDEKFAELCQDIRVWRVKGKSKGPRILLLGTIHGNERTAAYALETLILHLQKVGIKRGV